MRIITLGFPMPSGQVDNHSIANAPALFEYDACVLDPRAVSQQIEGIAAGSVDLRKPDGTPVQAGATGAFQFGLGELLELRRDEMARLLGKGGTVVVIGYPTVPHHSVGTLPGANRYTILPAPDGVRYAPPQLLPADGAGVTAIDLRHAFAGYLQDFSKRITYRARWDTTRIEHFELVGTVFGRSAGGADVAVEFQVGPGRVVFLPPLSNELRGPQRRPLTEVLVDGLMRSVEAPPLETPPSWVSRFDLPGLEESSTRLQLAEQAFAEAEGGLAEARAFHDEAERFRGLLWRAGTYGFKPLVEEAMRTLGFDVSVQPSGSTTLKDASEVALLEVDASESTVDERKYLSLQRRIEDEFLRSGVRRKGVIVVNGERLTAPAQRKAPYAETLANACANFGYALLTGETLFTLVTYALEGLDDAELTAEEGTETLAAIRESILTSDGLVSVEETEESEVEAEVELELDEEGAVETPEDAVEEAEAELVGVVAAEVVDEAADGVGTESEAVVDGVTEGGD